MLFGKKKAEPIPYDAQTQKPAVRKSICTGEMTGGFVDRKTGKFQDWMLLEDQKAVEIFCERTGITTEDLTTVY